MTAKKKKCPHFYVQIEEFNALGQTVSCAECNATFEMEDTVGAEDYYPFIYTIAGRGEREIVFLIHRSRIRREET